MVTFCTLLRRTLRNELQTRRQPTVVDDHPAVGGRWMPAPGRHGLPSLAAVPGPGRFRLSRLKLSSVPSRWPHRPRRRILSTPSRVPKLTQTHNTHSTLLTVCQAKGFPLAPCTGSRGREHAQLTFAPSLRFLSDDSASLREHRLREACGRDTRTTAAPKMY